MAVRYHDKFTFMTKYAIIYLSYGYEPSSPSRELLGHASKQGEWYESEDFCDGLQRWAQREAHRRNPEDGLPACFSNQLD